MDSSFIFQQNQKPMKRFQKDVNDFMFSSSVYNLLINNISKVSMLGDVTDTSEYVVKCYFVMINTISIEKYKAKTIILRKFPTM